MPVQGRHVSRLSGYAPAVPTPFDQEGAIDTAAFERFCEAQIDHGASALVVCGTTGEAPTLTRSEHDRIVRIAVDVARGRLPVIAGAGSNATSQAIEFARDAEAAGADAILSVVPYYNKPMQAGMEAHFRAIANATGLPIVLYDVPSRTACSLADATIARLAENPQFIGLKDASGDVIRLPRLRALVGADFRLLSGDDRTAPAFIAQGGNGCISVTANVVPGMCRAMYLALRREQSSLALRIAAVVTELTDVLFKETNPGPVKFALSMLNLMPARVRLPLVEPAEPTKAEIAAALADLCARFPDCLVGRLNAPGRAAVSAVPIRQSAIAAAS
jgi:4-hydroxy-tetrahydrodipicolinate synthase